jgi:hypothetical protein
MAETTEMAASDTLKEASKTGPSQPSSQPGAQPQPTSPKERPLPSSVKKPLPGEQKPPSSKKIVPAPQQPSKSRVLKSKSSPGKRAGQPQTSVSKGRTVIVEAEPIEALPEPEPVLPPVLQTYTPPSGITRPILEPDVDDNRSLIMTAAILGAILVIGVVAYFVLSSLRDSGDSPPTTVGSTPGKKAASTPARATREALRSELTVGHRGDYSTIGEALAQMQATLSPQNENVPRTIRVDGGCDYAERIELNKSCPRNLKIVVTGDEPAVLAPSGAEPVVTLHDSEGVSVEGFRINATDKEVAISLKGSLPGAGLRNLIIEDFSLTGVLGERAAGKNRSGGAIVIADCEFHPATPGAAAVRFRTGDATIPTTDVSLTGLRVVGPLDAGVVFDDNAGWIDIRESQFHDVNAAITFKGEPGRWRVVTLHNNLFQNVSRGIVFESMPTRSEDLAFSDNRFIDISGPEAIVENGYVADAFQKFLAQKPAPAIRGNMSTRPAPDTPLAGEIDLFANGGARGQADLQPQFEPASATSTAPTQ